MTKEKEESIVQKIIKGPSLGYTDNFPKREMWREIVKLFKGEFEIRFNPGHVVEYHRIIIPHKDWKINISVSDTRPLKFQASFISHQDLDFIISWEDFLERIKKKFGKKEIEFGWKEFDNHYMIECNRSDLIKKTITNKIQKGILKHNIYYISYQTDSESRKSELLSVIQRQAGNKELIVELIELFKSLIDNLYKSRIIK